MIPEIFSPPAVYSDPIMNNVYLQQFYGDTTVCLDAAHRKEFNVVEDILTKWATQCKGVGNSEGEITMCSHGFPFLEAYHIMNRHLELCERNTVSLLRLPGLDGRFSANM